jgi:thermitase
MGAGRIVVAFKRGAGQAVRANTHRAAGAISTADIGVPDVMVANVQPGAVQQALAAYRGRQDVAWAEPDYVRRVTVTPNDPSFAPPQGAGQWGLQKVGLPIAWDVTTGASAPKIAILDCGIFTESSPFLAPDGMPGHPDLRGKVDLAAQDEMNFSDALTGADDLCNHGTKMAGIAGARTNNAIGVAGAGFDVRLLNAKVLNDNGEGFDSWVAAGIKWAADKGAGVISMSLGGDGSCSMTLQSQIDYAWSKGAVLVAAAGNGGSDGVGDPAPDSPASCNHVIAVGAIDQQDVRAKLPGQSHSFSNYGSGVPLAAPGLAILATNHLGTYSNVNGTSPATPHVAAAAALVRAAHSSQSNGWVHSRLLSTADPIAGTGTEWANGRVNVAAAVGPSSCSPRPNVSMSATPGGSILHVAVAVAGVGNAIRYVQVNGAGGASTNALLTFPATTSSEWAGATNYVASKVGTTATFQVARQTAGQPTTVPLNVVDGCGTWPTFVGGGVAAGF